MAKRKGLKGRFHRPKVKAHVGVGAGIAGTVYKIMFTTGPGAVGGGAPAISWLMDASQTPTNRVKYAVSSMGANLKQFDTYVPLIGGALVTAAPRIPIISMVAKPVDNMLAKMTHGKLRL